MAISTRQSNSPSQTQTHHLLLVGGRGAMWSSLPSLGSCSVTYDCPQERTSHTCTARFSPVKLLLLTGARQSNIPTRLLWAPSGSTVPSSYCGFLCGCCCSPQVSLCVF
uniref:Uncharacterized protein n=1 Tax=Timema genevievae TaxID=629358 RepID=A0A7R9PL06_TIMGE|nr:unnamed protein product [Timema genevievae]